MSGSGNNNNNISTHMKEMDMEYKKLSALSFFKLGYFREMITSVVDWNIETNENAHFIYLENQVPFIEETSGNKGKDDTNNFFSLVVNSPDILPEKINGKSSVCKYTCTIAYSTRQLYTDIFTKEIMSASNFHSMGFETNDKKEIRNKGFASVSPEERKNVKERKFYIKRLRFGYAWNTGVILEKGKSPKGKPMVTEIKNKDMVAKKREETEREIKDLLNKWRESVYMYLFKNIYRTFKWAKIVGKVRELEPDALEELDQKLLQMTKDGYVKEFSAFLKGNYQGVLYDMYNMPLSLKLSKEEFDKELGSYAPVFKKSGSVYTTSETNNLFGEFAYANMRLSGDQSEIMSDFFKRCLELRERDKGGKKLMDMKNFEEYIELHIKEIEESEEDTGEYGIELRHQHKKKMKRFKEKIDKLEKGTPSPHARERIKKIKGIEKKNEERHKNRLKKVREIHKHEQHKEAEKYRELLKRFRSVPEDIREPIQRWQMQKFLEITEENIGRVLEGWNKAEHNRYKYLGSLGNKYVEHTNTKIIEDNPEN